MPALVYVVDDEIVIATTVVAILNKSGFEAKAFFTPQDVLTEAEVHPPNILISDVAMPKMNGIELGILFKAKCPSCKILLFSGHAASSGLLENARRDGHDFTLLNKPVHPADLLAALKGVPATSGGD